MRIFFIVSLVLGLSGCATGLVVQQNLNQLVAQGKVSQAVELSKTSAAAYGGRNQLLYLLDRGVLLHYSGQYQESIKVFEEAISKYNALYTKSVTKEALTWLVNDYAAPYRGEDFERVMVNVFQALNYFLIYQPQEALVEARACDSLLGAINVSYSASQKNVYKEDAFARFLIGQFYESTANNQDYNDAYISYARAAAVYLKDYLPNYKLKVPEQLKDDLFSAAIFMGGDQLLDVKRNFGQRQVLSFKEKNKKAKVILIQYCGFAPFKEEIVIPVPTFDGHIVQYAFPKYTSIISLVTASRLIASGGLQTFHSDSEPVEDITAIAILNLENRRARIVAKGLASSTGKYFIERKQEENIRKRSGDTAANLFGLFSDIYNVVTSRADLRCWRTLPDKIRFSRLILEPGLYQFKVLSYQGDFLIEEATLGETQLKAGETKVFIVRTAK